MIKTSDKRCVLMLALLPFVAIGQTSDKLTLQECYKLATQNYPLVKQRELIQKSSDFTLANIARGSLPQISLSGQLSYQSEVTKIPVKIPGATIPVLDKDQYKLYGEVNQPLTDLITVKQQMNVQHASVRLLQQNLESELYKVKERVNQLFFGILLFDEQQTQNKLTEKDIQMGINRITASIRNGTEFRSSLDKLKAEMLKAEQRDTELKACRKAYSEMLGQFINKTGPSADISLLKPSPILGSNGINRPEIKALELQKDLLEKQNKVIETRALPKFSAYIQTGLGRPSPVNMLSNDLSGYYIGGLRLNWSISNFYTLKREKKLNEISKDQADIQKETFLFNLNQTLTQENEEIAKINELLRTDEEILKLRISIKKAAIAQLENGVITVNDYLKEINAEDQARQSASLHYIQLLQAQYNYQTTAGTQE